MPLEIGVCNNEENVIKVPLLRLVTILATCIVAVALLLGLGFDRQGSAELFLSGVALFLLKDILEQKASPYLREHRRRFQLMVASFSPGFSIFLILAAIELAFYPNLQSFQKELLTIDLLAATLLILGTVPYASWILKSRK